MSEHQEKHIKHLTLLHSNDLHGDFMAEELDERLVGGVAMLSGYINKTRAEVPNTLYMIAGDMFRGSLIDSEFQGISTIEIMNALGPDIVSLGNHELDYGIAHLLFLERCCKFPIVNANIYIKTNGMRLFNSHKIIEMDGMNILVIGIVTEEIMGRAKKDTLLGTFVDMGDAAREVGIIVNGYKGVDIDFTILLTHIGYENDIELAKQLDPELGVDVIIGGHSHTLLERPAEVNNILIVQAGIGTDQIGRMDIEIDTDRNAVDSFTWETIPIDEKHCVKNEAIEELIRSYKKITDEKYGVILTTLPAKVTHPFRYQETVVGNLFCDMLQDRFGPDLVMVGSGSLRKDAIGPIITAGDLMDMYSFDEKLVQVTLTGAQIKSAMRHVLSEAPESGDGHSEYYQLSKGWHFAYMRESESLVEADYEGRPIDDDRLFKVGIEGYHLDNMGAFLGIDADTVMEREPARLITGNIRVALDEYMRENIHFNPKLEGRTEFID